MKKGQMKELVREILTNKPDTRSDDTLLCVEFANRTGKSLNIADGIGWIRSVVRVRALIQQNNPMLRANETVTAFRTELESEERQWIRDNF